MTRRSSLRTQPVTAHARDGGGHRRGWQRSGREGSSIARNAARAPSALLSFSSAKLMAVHVGTRQGRSERWFHDEMQSTRVAHGNAFIRTSHFTSYIFNFGANTASRKENIKNHDAASTAFDFFARSHSSRSST